MKIPDLYMSVRTAANGERVYAAIYKGMPLSADSANKASAMRALETASRETGHAIGDAWDGDSGEFVGSDTV